jgi:ubiquinone/menaquinone biosynthesis C-methylase UbiE
MSNQLTDFSANVERFSGFADLYDRYRPEPPEVLGDLLCRLAQACPPERVVDLGCGTGLSTRYWATRARRVMGVDPSADMRRLAVQQTRAANIEYVEGFSHATGLPAGCADIVTCSQALHWMEPQATFTEAARILRPGGVFAAYDYDWPPATGFWQADQAYSECWERLQAAEHEANLGANVKRWTKEGHLGRMQASGCFRYTRELVLHHHEMGSAERLVGLLLSQGGVMTLLKAGRGEGSLGIAAFRETVHSLLGQGEHPWVWSSRVRVGIV